MEILSCQNYDVQVQWGTFTKAPDQTRGSVFTGLAAKINPFTIDAARAVTATILRSEWERGARYVDLETLREPGTAVFVVIPEGAASRYKIPLGTFIGQAIEHLRAGEVTDDTTPVMFVVDEAAHVPVVNLKELPGVGRGRRFGVMLFYQNLSQGFDMYGEHGFNAILGSINTKTFLPGCDSVTARYASELVGQTTIWGRGFDDSPRTQYDRSRTTETSRALMDPAEIRQLPVHLQAITIVETMPPVKWTYPKSAKTGPRVIPRRYGMPRIVNFTDAEGLTSERRLREAAAERLSLPSGGEAARSDQTQVSVVSAEATPKQAKAKVRVRKKSASNEEHVKEQTDESLRQPKAAPEEVIKEKTHESVGRASAFAFRQSGCDSDAV